MVSVYTDVSLRKGKAVATCLVMTTTTFIGYRTFEYDNVCTTMQGELLGILDGLRYLESCSDILGDDSVEVLCDSEAALGQINGTANSKLYQSTVAEIHKLLPNNHVEFNLIRGHQMQHNSNKVVDKVSNRVLRYKYPRKKQKQKCVSERRC